MGLLQVGDWAARESNVGLWITLIGIPGAPSVSIVRSGISGMLTGVHLLALPHNMVET
jgi:hypothetical protein